MMSVSGKKVLITGGSRGIGRAIALAFKNAGAEVIISGSNPQSLELTAQELGVHCVAANLADEKAVANLAQQVGHVDVLINNAGVTRDALFIKQSTDEWNDVLRVNLDAAVQLTRLLLPDMQKNRFGRVINVSSVVAHMGNIGQTNYITSKAALTGFTKALAQEVARRNITVNCIAPGFIETSMTEKMNEKEVAEFKAKIPSRRLGKPEEIASAAIFLAGEDAGYITGTTLHVNGGLYM